MHTLLIAWITCEGYRGWLRVEMGASGQRRRPAGESKARGGGGGWFSGKTAEGIGPRLFVARHAGEGEGGGSGRVALFNSVIIAILFSENQSNLVARTTPSRHTAKKHQIRKVWGGRGCTGHFNWSLRRKKVEN